MNEILLGDIRDIAKTLPAQSVNCIATSPPYFGLRDYGVDKQIGFEATPEAYVNTLVGIFRELKRVLRDDGSVWLNLGDSYANGGAQSPGEHKGLADFTEKLDGIKRYSENWATMNGAKKPIKRIASSSLKPKNLIGIPWRVAFALQADGWILRSDIIWHKKNPMPESVKDRPTKAHEYIFLLSKKPRYYYDGEAVREAANTPPHNSGYVSGELYAVGPMNRNGHSQREDPDRIWAQNGKRNKRTVWTVSTKPYKAAHFAVFPPDLIRPCILAGCPPGGVVLDPFMGSGTVAQVAIETGRNWLGVELNPEYIELAKKRIAQTQPPLPIEAVL